MSEKQQNDTDAAVCGKGNKRFGGVSCEYYFHSVMQCMLLKEHRIKELWEKCRINHLELLYNAVMAHLARFKQRYRKLPIDEQEDVDFDQIIRCLKAQEDKKRFDISTLNDWRKYIGKAAYLEIRRIFIKRGLIPKEARCGICRYLPQTKPYICLKKREVRKKTNPACDEYRRRDVIIPVADDEIEHEQIKSFILPNSEENNEEITIESAINALNERIRQTKPGTKEREKSERQYEVFFNLCHLMSDGHSKEEAKNILADNYGISLKTIARDINEIKEFLEKMFIFP